MKGQNCPHQKVGWSPTPRTYLEGGSLEVRGGELSALTPQTSVLMQRGRLDSTVHRENATGR